MTESTAVNSINTNKYCIPH